MIFGSNRYAPRKDPYSGNCWKPLSKNLSSLNRTKIGPHGSNLKPLETG